MMKIMEMHAQNVICGPQKKKIRKKLFLAKLFTKKQKSIPNLPQVTLPTLDEPWVQMGIHNIFYFVNNTHIRNTLGAR